MAVMTIVAAGGRAVVPRTAGTAALGAVGGILTAGLDPVTGAGQAILPGGRGPTADQGRTPPRHTWVTTARPRAETTPPAPTRSWTKAVAGPGASPGSDCVVDSTELAHILIRGQHFLCLLSSFSPFFPHTTIRLKDTSRDGLLVTNFVRFGT